MAILQQEWLSPPEPDCRRYYGDPARLL